MENENTDNIWNILIPNNIEQNSKMYFESLKGSRFSICVHLFLSYNKYVTSLLSIIYSKILYLHKTNDIPKKMAESKLQNAYHLCRKMQNIADDYDTWKVDLKY